MTAPYVVATLPSSAHRETPWARALHDGWRRHGPTPLYDEVVAALGPLPECSEAAVAARGADGRWVG
jgi:hypothetical protein